MSDETAPLRRRRQARSLRNDAAILDAAAELADTAGWPALMLASVAEQADLSRQAVISRHRDRSDLAAAAWTQRLAPTLDDLLASLVEATPSPETGLDPEQLQSALRPFYKPDQDLRAAAELLLVSRYDDLLGRAVDQTTGRQLRSALRPVPRKLTRAQAVRRAWLVSMALGLLLESRRSPIGGSAMREEIEQHCWAMTVQAGRRFLPQDAPEHLDLPVDFGTHDPLWEALLQAALDEVGTRGYEGATINIISLRAGCSSGAVFARYDSKLDLFIDASQRMLSQAGRLNQQFEAGLDAKYGIGIGLAVGMREHMVAHRRTTRSVGLEQHRLTWHNDKLQDSWAAAAADVVWHLYERDPEVCVEVVRARAQMWVTVPLGTALLADLCPDSWCLPWDVITVPLAQSRTRGD